MSSHSDVKKKVDKPKYMVGDAIVSMRRRMERMEKEIAELADTVSGDKLENLVHEMVTSQLKTSKEISNKEDPKRIGMAGYSHLLEIIADSAAVKKMDKYVWKANQPAQSIFPTNKSYCGPYRFVLEELWNTGVKIIGAGRRAYYVCVCWTLHDCKVGCYGWEVP